MVLPAGQAAAGGGRLVFPQDPTVQRPGAPGSAVRNASGGTATIYADTMGTQLADIQNLDGTAIAGSLLLIDTYSRLPLFLGPAGRDTVFVSVDGGPVTAVYARADDRLDGHDAQLAAFDSRLTVHDNHFGTLDTRMANAEKPWLNVLAYGAKGDNVTDDQPAIQAAIDDCRQGGVVFLPPGFQFRVAKPLQIVKGITLRGGGWNPRQPARTNMVSTFLRPATGGTFVGSALIVVNPAVNAPAGIADSAYNGGPRVEGLALSGRNANNSTAAAIDGIQCQPGVKDLEIRSVTAWQFTGQGFALADAANVLLVDAVASYSGGAGFTFTSATEVEMTNCMAYGNTGDGFVLPSPNLVTLLGCQADRNGGYGFNISGNNNGTQLVSCATDRNTKDGYLLQHTGGRAVMLTSCLAKRDGRADNVTAAGYAGFRVAPAGGVTGPGAQFTACQVYVANDDDNTGLRSPDYGLRCDAGANRITINGGSYLGTVAALQDNASCIARTSGVTTGTVSSVDGSTSLSLQDRIALIGAAGNTRELEFWTRTGGKRWSVRSDSTAESGTNAGTNFGIARYTDAGALIDTPFWIDRKTGVVSVDNLDINIGAMGMAPTPRNHGLVAWVADPVTVQNYTAPAAGVVYLDGVWVPRQVPITKIIWGIGIAGAAPVAGQNVIGLYDAAGNLLVSVNIDARVAAAGTFTETFAAITVNPGLYRVGWVFNATTMPSVFRSTNIHAPLTNAGITDVTKLRCAQGPSAQTGLPASIAPSSLISFATAFWAAIG